MPGTFTYTEVTNKIKQTDGTSGAPATFNDMYLADQAGTGTDLLPAEAGTSGPGNSLTYAIRPTHDKALIIKCIVAGKTAEADYIFITGTDAWGAAQTESLDVSAGNGTYTTTKRFATVTEFDCSDNAAGGGVQWADGMIQVTQDIWGVIWEHVADGQYRIDANVDFGDGSTASYFASVDELVWFEDGLVFEITTAATLRLGTLEAGWGINGAHWSLSPSSDMTIIVSGQTGTFNVYASSIKIRSLKRFIASDGAVDMRNSIFSHSNGTNSSITSFNISGVASISFQKMYLNNLNLIALPASGTLVGIHAHRSRIGFFASIAGAYEKTLVTETAINDYYENGNATLTVTDSESPISKPHIRLAGGAIIEQYTTNIHVTDKDGADLQSVDVDCEYAHLVEGTDSKTYKCIQDHTSVDATHKPITGSDWASFWELYDAAGGLGGDWQTTFDFKASTQEFATQTTDADGDITEQVIQYKKWTTTSELLEARIHKFTYSHASYPDFVMSDVIVDHPLVWEHDMGQSTSDLTAIIQNAQVDDDGSPISLAGALRLLLATGTGKSSGGGTGTIVFRDVNDSKDRISATVDSDGNRTAIGARDSS
ncbi:MAG: hypothetical protein QGD93_09335 [Actinomycetota bacterium]|nr:hypothetical protein [Actinomycetota bacterium]